MGNSTIASHEISANLRAAKQRLNMHRTKKLNEIEKKTDVIVENMKSGQENLALIQAESIITNERAIECYDVLAIMVEQVVERIRLMEKFPQAPPDMEQTFATLIYASNRCEVTELAIAKQHLTKRYGEKYIHGLMQNVGLVNDIVRDKIDLVMPKMGDKALKVEQILQGKGLPVNFTVNTANELRKKKEELNQNSIQFNPIMNTGNQQNNLGIQNNYPQNFSPQNNFPQNNFLQNNINQPYMGMTPEMQNPLPKYGSITESGKSQPPNYNAPNFNSPNFNPPNVSPINLNPPTFNPPNVNNSGFNPSSLNPQKFNPPEQTGPSWYVPSLKVPGNMNMLGPTTGTQPNTQISSNNQGFQQSNNPIPPHFQAPISPPQLFPNPNEPFKTGLEAIPMVQNSSYLSESNSLSDLQNRSNKLNGQ